MDRQIDRQIYRDKTMDDKLMLVLNDNTIDRQINKRMDRQIDRQIYRDKTMDDKLMLVLNDNTIDRQLVTFFYIFVNY